ncbi:MAG: AbrB family transcriptional regulator [Candidatus Hydromicrobium americanum]|jgi:antitoxin PrlF|nr:MAG: AbrB family transcriptional regulator [Candidatus Hydromicrobium americanum]
MKEIVTTITKKGQVTIPVEIRRLLSLKAKDKVAFSIENNKVRIAPAKYTIETVFGAIKPLKKPEEFNNLRKIAIKEHTDKVVEEMK